VVTSRIRGAGFPPAATRPRPARRRRHSPEDQLPLGRTTPREEPVGRKRRKPEPATGGAVLHDEGAGAVTSGQGGGGPGQGRGVLVQDQRVGPEAAEMGVDLLQDSRLARPVRGEPAGQPSPHRPSQVHAAARQVVGHVRGEPIGPCPARVADQLSDSPHPPARPRPDRQPLVQPPDAALPAEQLAADRVQPPGVAAEHDPPPQRRAGPRLQQPGQPGRQAPPTATRG
jgi:hypothetical protein